MARSSSSSSSGRPKTIRPGAWPVVVSIAASEATILTHVGPAIDERRRRGGEGGGSGGLDAERRAVAIDGTDGEAGRQEPRSRDHPRGDAVAQDELEAADGARATRARDTSAEGAGRVCLRGGKDRRIGAGGDGLQAALGRIERVVGMGVDQPGQSRPASAIDDDGLTVDGHSSRAGALGGGSDGGDQVVLDDDVLRALRASVVAETVDDPDAGQDRPHRGYPSEIVATPSPRRRWTSARRSAS